MQLRYPRVRRLDQLSREVALEISIVTKADDPMLYVERQAYLAAMRQAMADIETAYVVLAKARRRLERR
jgi:isopentenyldiphosphate isomerase